MLNRFRISNFNHALPHRALSRVISRAAIMLVMLVLAMQSSRITVAQQVTAGTSSRQLRKEVVNSLPYAQLNAQTKAKIGDILEKPSLYRRLPVTAIEIDPEYLQFLIRYPEVVVGIWELMGITDMETKRVGNYTLKTDDGMGTTSDMELVYGSSDLHIYYGQGLYEGPVLRKKLSGDCVIIVRTRPHSEINAGEITAQRPGGIPKTACQLDVFLKLDNGAAGMIAKTISPIVGPTADHNFTESLKFVERLNQTTIKNGPGVQEMGRRLKVDPEVIEKFQAVVGRVYQRAQGLPEDSGNPYDYDFSNSSQSSATSRSPVTAHPMHSSQSAAASYPYHQQSYQQSVYPYPHPGQGNVRTYNIDMGDYRSYGPSAVQRAIFTDQR